MTPGKRKKITEDALREVHERCQQKQANLRADLERQYWYGDGLDDWEDDAPILCAITVGLVGLTILALLIWGIGTLVVSAGGGA